MNFIKKLARELQLSKRRHSAPVLVDEPHKYKEEQYKQALQTFTGWRAENVGGKSQTLMERINEEELLKGSTSSGEKSSPTYADIEENGGDHSPPARFFRTNSIPDLAKSPRKSTVLGERKTSKRRHNKGPAPPPPNIFNANAPLPKVPNKTAKNCLNSKDTDTEDTDKMSGCYRRFTLDSQITTDDFLKYPNPHLIDLPEENDAPKKYPRRRQQPTIPISPKKSEYDEVIDVGFQFLQENYGNYIDSTVDGSHAGGREHVLVTDLDKSDDTHPSFTYDAKTALSQILIDAVDAHDEQMKKEKIWSQQTLDESLFDPFYTRFQDFYRTQNVIVCWPDELKYEKGYPRTTIVTPLEFARGTFRNARVSVRKYKMDGDHKDFNYAESASRRDFDILNYLRHPDVAVLMAVKLDRQLQQISLIMEAFDFTLNYYLYKYKRDFTLAETIAIVQKLASAVEYLHECGYVHSNISSHAVMMSRDSLSVKLSCFELTTSVNYEVKNKLNARYGSRVMGKAPKRVPQTDNIDKEMYIQLSRQTHKHVPSIEVPKMEKVDPKYLPYFLNFRQNFSMHYYQAPELVKTNVLYVVPRKECDVYSLTVLLWEMLNRCTPYVMFTYEELEAIHTYRLGASMEQSLPIIDEERCKFFDEIFRNGLMTKPEDRFHLAHFHSCLEERKWLEDEQKARDDIEKQGITPTAPENPNLATLHRNKDKVSLKKDLKGIKGIFDDFCVDEPEKAESCDDELIHGDYNEPMQRKNSQRTNGELSDVHSFTSLRSSLREGSARKKRSSIIAQLYEDKPNDPLFNLSQSTIFASNGDFHNKLLETARMGDRLERTSTTKKKKSRTIERAMNIFSGEPIKSRKNLNAKLDATCDLEKSNESSKAAANEQNVSTDKQKNLSSTSFVERAKARLERCFLNGSKNWSSEEDLLAAVERKPHQERKTSTISLKLDSYSENGERSGEQESSLNKGKLFSPSKYSFNVGKCDLPNGPIARKNKLRRFAWLSDRKPTLSPNGSSFNFLSDDSTKDVVPLPQTFKFNATDNERHLSNTSLNNSFAKKMNVNLKVNHNNKEIFNNSFTSDDADVEADINKKINQIRLDLSKDPNVRGQNGLKPKIEIKMIGHRDGESCEIQREILDLSAQIVGHFDNNRKMDETLERSSFERDSRRMMIVRPEDIKQQIKKAKRQESLARFENMWHREKSLCERTSYHGSLPSDTEEDQENCAVLANCMSGGEGSTDTEDLYIDDDQFGPTMSVNIDLDLMAHN